MISSIFSFRSFFIVAAIHLAAIDDVEPTAIKAVFVAKPEKRLEPLTTPFVAPIERGWAHEEDLGHIEILSLESDQAVAHEIRAVEEPEPIPSCHLLFRVRRDIERQIGRASCRERV